VITIQRCGLGQFYQDPTVGAKCTGSEYDYQTEASLFRSCLEDAPNVGIYSE